MTSDSTVLLDTNILIYAENVSSPYYRKANNLVKRAWERKISACVAIQNLVEFFAIITDIKRTASPLSSQEARGIFFKYIEAPAIKKIYEQEFTENILLRLIKQDKPKGQKVHDIRLIAIMLSNNITTIYTADSDFKKFKEIKAINPFE